MNYFRPDYTAPSRPYKPQISLELLAVFTSYAFFCLSSRAAIRAAGTARSMGSAFFSSSSERLLWPLLM